MEPISRDCYSVGRFEVGKCSLDVLEGGACRWLYDNVIPLGKVGESLGLAPVSTGNDEAVSVRCERPQSDGHAPPFYSPMTAAIAGNQCDH